ncbi:MAG: hypothetical protein OXF93_03505 [Acidobacteria bacterium]|nr:hypothetical protein [Acidobacteriota bacterium]
MLWQELAVAVIVGFSVVWLVRHMRSILVVPSRPGSDAGASCHGCDDCGEESGAAPAPRPLAGPGPGTVH